MTRSVFFALGSNLGNRVENLQQARLRLSLILGEPRKVSAFYETAPWGKTDQPSFVNQVIQWQSSLAPSILLQTAIGVEHQMGRVRQEKWGARVIDIDVLYVGNQIINTPEFQLPHPEIQGRRFVLVPLAEIAPDFQHPTLQLSNQKLLELCPDPLLVTLLQA